MTNYVYIFFTFLLPFGIVNDFLLQPWTKAIQSWVAGMIFFWGPESGNCSLWTESFRSLLDKSRIKKGKEALITWCLYRFCVFGVSKLGFRSRMLCHPHYSVQLWYVWTVSFKIGALKTTAPIKPLSSVRYNRYMSGRLETEVFRVCFAFAAPLPRWFNPGALPTELWRPMPYVGSRSDQFIEFIFTRQ